MKEAACRPTDDVNENNIRVGVGQSRLRIVPICNALYRSADKYLARPTSRCILFDGENISFDASLVLHIYIHI